MEQIEALYEKINKNNEFEFIFFSKKNNMTLEKYIAILKFLSKRTINKTYKLVSNDITLDISYMPDKETSYRCTLNNYETIDKYMKKFATANNHIIFKNLVKLSSQDKNITTLRKNKNSERTIEIDDFYMRVRLADELELTENEIKQLSSLDNTAMNKISFRYKDRTSLYFFQSDDIYCKTDLTVTKTAYKYEQINSSIPHYELEIETKSVKSEKKILDLMLDETELLLKVYQQSNYIITKTIADKVIEAYQILLAVPTQNKHSLYGRQPVSLEIQRLASLADKYAVTDKADGERHFLVIFDNHVYLLNKNLDVKDTGISIKKKDYNNTVLDGELVFLKNRHIFLVFDCLFKNGIDIRKEAKLELRLKHADDIIDNCFIFEKQKGTKYETLSSKDFNLNKELEFHQKNIKNMLDNLNHDIDIEKQFVLIRRKYFIHALGAKPWEIYAYSSLIWNMYVSNSSIKCPYVLDGLVYQPNDQSYIANAKESLNQDYKWKPPKKNSIDFYIEFVIDPNSGDPIIVYDNSYEEITDEPAGIGSRIRNVNYKICKLHVGNAIGQKQVPVPFREDDGLDEAYIALIDGEARDIDGNILINKTVVEFYYNTNSELPNKFKWIPIRTRYDKTEAVSKYKRDYGNFITIADKVWKSIINPILMNDFDDLAQGNNPEKNQYLYDKKMESIRQKIKHEDIVSATKENVYFQKITNLAKPMRNFHNFIKSILIYTFVHSMYQDYKKKSVLDLGCGRGGDQNKFYYAKIAFYIGIDNDKDALFNPIDGAVSRYSKLKSKPGFGSTKMYFIVGDMTSKLDYENQFKSIGGMDYQNKQLIEKFFSDEPVNKTTFDIIHYGFSIHYGLKNEDTWANTKSNINKCLRADGYVIITTFDGNSVRKLLKGKDKYTQHYTDENGNVKVLFEIVKKYQDVDDNTIMGVGNAIDVHMEWISNEGVYLTEYLVDERFIVNELEKDCNLELVTSDSFKNQYNIHKEYLTQYARYEAEERTREGILKRAAEYYEQTDINDKSREYTFMEKYYVFRKNSKAKQKGGNFIDPNKFAFPSTLEYDDNYSLLNSIHHVLKSHKIIPKSLSPEDFYKDMDIKYENDMNIESKLKKIAKNIVIYHQDENNKREKVIDGLNIFLTERDCNNEYDVSVVKKCKRVSKNDLAIIIMKEGGVYVPVYINENNVKNGLFRMDDTVIKELIV